MTTMTAELGARNLILNCAKAVAGDRLLIAYEPPEFGYFDSNAVSCVAGVASALGLSVDMVDVGFNPHNPHLPGHLLHRFERTDIILFLARLGDQLRFSDMPPGKKIVVSFALNLELLGSGFANGHHNAFTELKKCTNQMLASAQNVRVTCSAGTDVIGRPEMNLNADGDCSIIRFPMSVFTPVPARTFSGRVAISGFLTGTGSKYYDNYTIEFDGQVFAKMREGRLTGFDGQAQDVARAEAQYDRVASMFGIDRNFVHSWHAGIHPGCGYYWNMRENYERWGGSAFGNPRLMHFHTCGSYAPGEISWNVIDPSIEIDGVMVWDRGVFHAELIPGGEEILSNYSCAAALFAQPDKEIGLWSEKEIIA